MPVRGFDPLSRPSRDEWGLAIAAAVSIRGECTRRRIGAVITSPATRQTWIGYNGAPPGRPSCLEGACPRGRHYKVFDSYCTCGNPWPCRDMAAPDSSYDSGAGMCIATHAELNCLLDAGRSNLDASCVMYVSEKPCPSCERIIAGCLKRVVWPDGELSFLETRVNANKCSINYGIIT